MQDRCLRVLLALALWGVPICCGAQELAGKLVRVDRETVTLRGEDNTSLFLRVDHGERVQAAPFLGKSVTVDCRTDQGVLKALRFRSGH
jgi:hypothetical protein